MIAKIGGMDINLNPVRDSANTIPPKVNFERRGSMIVLTLEDPDREIQFDLTELEYAVQTLSSLPQPK